MISAVLGRKIGMTQMFNDNGDSVSVTAISVGPCVVLGITDKNVRLGYEDIVEKKVKKPQLGMFKKLNISPKRIVREVKANTKGEEIKVGSQIGIDIFKSGDFVDITGTSIGKGFQGGMKRWNWSGGKKSHGSMTHRRAGSIGSSADPSRVFRGHHMPGHMGNKRTTVQSLKVVNVDMQNNILLIEGAAPGPSNNLLVIKKAVKKQSKQQ